MFSNLFFQPLGKLYAYTRLPFEAIDCVLLSRVFDKLIDKYNLKEVYAFVCIITVSGYDKTDPDLKLLKRLLAVSKAENLTFDTEKCVFEKKQTDSLWHRVSHLKIQPDPKRLRPLHELLRTPKSKTQLQRAICTFVTMLKPHFSSN